jgi:pyridoxine 5-phosphate synthase
VGHGLNYTNAHWLQLVPHCEEANIGHAIVARAVMVGLVEAVREMKALINDPRYHPGLKVQ